MSQCYVIMNLQKYKANLLNLKCLQNNDKVEKRRGIKLNNETNKTNAKSKGEGTVTISIKGNILRTTYRLKAKVIGKI